MKTPVHAFALLLAFFAGLCAFGDELPSPPFSSGGFEQATKQAQDEKKIVLLDFFTTWCGPCKRLDQITWKDARVKAALAEKTVALKIDAEKETSLTVRFAVTAFPTVVLMRPDETVLDKIVGFLPPDAFLDRLNDALSGKNAYNEAIAALERAKHQDPVQKAKTRYEVAQRLAELGRNEEALREFLWCYDEGMAKQPEFETIRNSVLPFRIKQLGLQLPAAMKALIQRRDSARAKMMESAEQRQAVTEFCSLSGVLQDSDAIATAFCALPKGDRRRSAFGVSVFDSLVDRQAYGDALEAFPDSDFMMYFHQNLDSGKVAGMGAEVRAAVMEIVLLKVAERIESLAAVGRIDDAKKLIAETLAVDGSEGTRALIYGRLARIKQTELLQ